MNHLIHRLLRLTTPSFIYVGDGDVLNFRPALLSDYAILIKS